MHDSSNCPICQGRPINGSMSDKEFSHFLAKCQFELGEKQRLFTQRVLGLDSWFYDMETESVHIGGVIFRMIPIGTYSPVQRTWLWGWANESFPEIARQSSSQIKALHATTGFQVFLDEGIGATEEDSAAFSALAIHHLDAMGCFRCSSEDSVLYLGLFENHSE